MTACDTTQAKNLITLRGSAKIVTEYLDYGINSILFQRGIYPPETFKPIQQYGLTVLMSQDDRIRCFIENIMAQVRDWISEDKVQKISMVIKNVRTAEIVECWDFLIHNEGNLEGIDVNEGIVVSEKELRQIQREIREVMLQISGTVTFLPLLDCICSFDVYIHTSLESDVPNDWSETTPVNIDGMQDVPLRSFSTGLHNIETIVHYKMDMGC